MCINFYFKQPIQPGQIIIIQPGSLNLLIGRAVDSQPLTIPHCISRRNKSPINQQTQSTIWMRPQSMQSDSKQVMKHGLKTAEEVLSNRVMENGNIRPSTSYRELANHNTTVQAERTDIKCVKEWANTSSKPSFLIGEDAIHVHPSDQYRLSWPIQRGQLNIHEGPGGSLTAVIADLETIWLYVIEHYLDISKADFKVYRVILLIPDIYIHKHVIAMVDMLLDNLGFAGVIVHQESVCAVFGCGVTSACVVDVGDQKTSVCCVEDGISNKHTRITMEYGGGDVTRVFHWLLGRAGVPLRDLNYSSLVDGFVLQDLKETYCHLDLDVYGILDQEIEIKKVSKNAVHYYVKMGDELVLTPLSLLYPDMFGLQGNHLVRVQGRNEGDPSDPHDDHYLIQTQRQNREAGKLSSKKGAEEMKDTDISMNQDDSQFVSSQMDDDSNEAPDNLQTNTDSLQQNDTSKDRRKEMEEDEELEEGPVTQLMGIDEAILYSIEKCSNDDIKRKMYSCVLLVGGGMNYECTQKCLTNRIIPNIPHYQRLQMESMDILSKSKDGDPRIICWKGAAILACLDTTQELWIYQREWKQFNARMLRERAPFVW
ncbi:hypothetical protein LOTGIDRAFT_134368 [Lottia gigantea]|uniref:Uncharacterized protein n=1 Tax=Lottia gigantea TaxID=225164 RepID=V3YX11_LOTGI|nr:hypothetical protein LOTGIDRAFT_134368 [Lottia gigantea]ESO82598.1 hypothetical protein LOTGIDRAFT_134368 [Lottia gigantea]